VTEGNPFFIEELCKGLVEKGRLIYKDDRLEAVGKELLGIPSNVRLAIQTRILAMPPQTQKILEAAAIRGRRFEFDVIRSVERLDEIELSEALKSAERSQIIEELPSENGRRFGFTHTLIPAAMLDGMPSKRQQSLHARMAPVLETSSPEEYEALAHHYHAAGEAQKAIDYLLRAGDRAHSLYACQEAIKSFSQALKLQKDRQENGAAARTLLKMGLAYSADFEFDKAQRAYEEAFDLWELVWRSQDKAKAAEPAETLRFAIDEPLTLDPGRANDDPSSFIISQLFEGLLEVDAASGIVPALASRWDVSEDGRRYTFYLRAGWRWSDGRPLTAGDFEYAWKRNLSRGSQSPAAQLLNGIENAKAYAEGGGQDTNLGVRAVDDLTLEVRLEAPAAYFPQLLTHPVTYPLPRWAVEGERQPWTDVGNLVSNGPYQLKVWGAGDRMIFALNPYYRGLFPGNVRSVEAPTITQYTPMLEAFDRGSLDGISLINADPGTISHLKATYRREFRFTPMLSTLYVAFRTDLPPFDDARVRKAFIHAIDRTALLRETGSVHFEPAQGGFLPPGMPGHSPDIGLDVDAQAAPRLLAEAGYPGGDGFPPVEFLYSGDPEGNPVASYLRQQWKDVLGIAVKVQGLAWSEFTHRQESDPPQLAINGWQADYQDPDSMLRILFHSCEGVNDIRWSNHSFDSLTEQAAQLADRKVRIKLYREADRILVADEAVVMPLSYAQGRQLVKPYVKIPRSPPSLLRLKYAVVKRTPE
jgi:oligopeptide transport system substrate-binding protein